MTRVEPGGELKVDPNFPTVFYSRIRYVAEFSGKGDNLPLYLLSDRPSGICAERIENNDLLVCSNPNPDTEKRTVSRYQVEEGKAALTETDFDFGYASGVLASAPSGFKPPTRRAISLDYLRFTVDDGKPKSVHYRYNGRLGRTVEVWPAETDAPYNIEGSNRYIQVVFAEAVKQGAVRCEVREGRDPNNLPWSTRVTAPTTGEIPVIALTDIRVNRNPSSVEEVNVDLFDKIAAAIFGLAPRP